MERQEQIIEKTGYKLTYGGKDDEWDGCYRGFYIFSDWTHTAISMGSGRPDAWVGLDPEGTIPANGHWSHGAEKWRQSVKMYGHFIGDTEQLISQMESNLEESDLDDDAKAEVKRIWTERGQYQ